MEISTLTFSFAKMTKKELSQKALIDRFTGIWWLEKDNENLWKQLNFENEWLTFQKNCQKSSLDETIRQ